MTKRPSCPCWRARQALAVAALGLSIAAAGAAVQGVQEVQILDGVVWLEVDGIPLSELLQEISSRSGLLIEVERGLEEDVSLTVAGVPLAEALEEILRGQCFVLRRMGQKMQPVRLWVYSCEPAPGDTVPVTLTPRRSTPRSGDLEIRFEEIAALAARGDERAATALVAAALGDAAPAVREEAIEGLGELGEAIALPPLQRVLSDPEPTVRAAAVDCLAAIGGEGAAWILGEALDDGDSKLREQVVDALADIAGEAAFVLLRQALADEAEVVRRAAEEALAERAD